MHRVNESMRGVNESMRRARLRTIDKNLQPSTQHPLIQQPLIDLAVEQPGFAGVWTPAAELGAPRQGVNSAFLENAEEYYTKFQNFDYWRSLLKNATERAGITDAKAIVEFGCGFGNSTLPLLDLFPQAHIVASDISPNLLSILNRLLVARGLTDRCIAVAMDAQKDYVKPDCADLVVGSAILHHLVQPVGFVKQAMRILRPGGVAVFFEPLEGGYATLRLICQEIVREAERRKEEGQIVDLARGVAVALGPQIFREKVPGWEDTDDKWMFPRSVIDEMARNAGATLTIYPIHGTEAPFRNYFQYMMKSYRGLEPEELPSWAAEILDRFDKETYSPQMLVDMALEACLIFEKPKAGSTVQ